MIDGKQVLLIEDTKLHRKLYSSWLQFGGYRVNILHDERRANAIASSLQPDVIVVDIRLPQVSGLDVIESLKCDCRTSHIPVMAFTVLHSEHDRRACLEAGADKFLSKAAPMRTFLAEISDLVGEIL